MKLKNARTTTEKYPVKLCVHFAEDVRLIGLEPTRIATPDPKSGASTNFATSAKDGAKLVQTERFSKFICKILRHRLISTKKRSDISKFAEVVVT